MKFILRQKYFNLLHFQEKVFRFFALNFSNLLFFMRIAFSSIWIICIFICFQDSILLCASLASLAKSIFSVRYALSSVFGTHNLYFDIIRLRHIFPFFFSTVTSTSLFFHLIIFPFITFLVGIINSQFHFFIKSISFFIPVF